MENVVYILGAGFSAPLGLPVMSNFIEKAKDAYFTNKEKYNYFSEVFDEISKMSVIKNYFNANLFNIEEILSILEMSNSLSGLEAKYKFVDFLSDVIEYYTPKIGGINRALKNAGNWYNLLFDKNDSQYSYFISALLNLTYESKFVNNIGVGRERIIFCTINNLPQYKYSIITLNYDLVVENYMAFINEQYYSENIDPKTPLNKNLQIEKLHGCITQKNIVAPTWNKNLNDGILPAWKNSYDLLSKANHIRIIGYSLPESDTYIKYILKSAIVENKHLKTLDVICNDNSNQVKNRYTNFISYPNFRYSNKKTEEYLRTHSDFYRHFTSSDQNVKFPINNLEKAHNIFFNTN